MLRNISNYLSTRQDLLKGDVRNKTIDNKSNEKTNLVANRILAEKPRLELLSKQNLRSEERKEDSSPDYTDSCSPSTDYCSPITDYCNPSGVCNPDYDCSPVETYGLSNQ
ncbi:MAG: hypothetical protein KR126chlam5_00422 [Candidatus Anoxychlamydiales bacterium]|nr:hypothetical protein [Candidatus Anoxychlamydiales bacterium]